MMNRAVPHQDRTYGHIDLSTGDDAPHVTVEYTLKTRLPNDREIETPQDWKMGIRIPVTVRDTLRPEDWEDVIARMTTRRGDTYSPLEAMLATASVLNFDPKAVWAEIGRTVAEALYKKFVTRQIDAGNSAWVAPSSMQQVSDPNG